jgi:hypothetical protein
MIEGLRQFAISLLPFAFVVIAMFGGYHLSHKNGLAKMQAIAKSNFNMLRDHELISVEWYPDPTISHISCLTSEKVRQYVLIKNYSPFDITSSQEPSLAKPPVNIAYRLHRQGENQYYFESERTFMAGPLVPAADNNPSITVVPVSIKCPDNEETVIVQVELVQEAVAWQHDVSTKIRWAKAEVKSFSPTSAWKDLSDQFKWKFHTGFLNRQSDSIITEVVRIAESTLNLTVELIHRAGRPPVTAWAAGSIYPQIWGRDMATIQTALNLGKMKLPKGEDFWVDLFLEHQNSDGSMVDWLIPTPMLYGSNTGRNDVQSDQELWLIHAALTSVRTGFLPADWLEGSVSGESRRLRLIKALRWVIANRFDATFKCIRSGHVADWGDVGLVGKSELDSTKFAAGFPQVCGIFLQALFFSALQEVENVLGATAIEEIFSDEELQSSWRSKIREFVNTYLWDDQKGMFRIHFHLQTHEHPFDESQIYALGGNTLAVTSGLASPRQTELIMHKMIKGQRQNALPTVGFVLVPPYPQNTFQNPIMDEEFEYQNGGDWDWYGLEAARVLLLSNPKAGMKALLEIARKINRNGIFWEWNRVDGKGEGAKHMRVGAARFLATTQQSNSP